MMTRLLILGSLLGAAIGASAQEPPPFAGTWKLNVAKSSFGATPPPKSDTTVMTAVENGYRVVTDQVNPEGKAIRYEYTVRFDGKDYPVTGSPKFEAISVNKIDDRTFDWIMKKGGKVVSRGRTAYSPDGKLRTLTYAWADSSGQKFEITAIFERQ
jgi:hypothetical protein